LAEAFYPIGVAHTNDRTDGDYVTLSSNLLLIWSVGGMIGPLIGTTALQFGGPDAFFWYVIALSLLLAGFLRWRLRRKHLEEVSREEFLSYPHASPTVFEWSPHTPLPQERSPRPGTERGGRG
jgi:MFS family permease